MRNKIFIRADGSSQIGLGHLVRCTALANMLKDDFEISFVCKIIPDELVLELKSANISINIIVDEDNFLSFLNSNEIAVLDGYNFDMEFQRKIKQKGAKLVCIDDMNFGEFVADLIISQTPDVKESEYKAQSYTKFALGLEYALLRSPFLENTKSKRSIKKIDTLFLCFGGSDSFNLTLSSLKAVINFPKFKRIIVITGTAYKYNDELTEITGSDNRIEHHNNIDANKIVSLMFESDLAIAPSSSIILELFSVGVPAITGFYVENQKRGSKAISDMGLAISCGDMSIDYLKKLHVILNNFTIDAGNQMVNNQKEIKWVGKQFYRTIFKAL